MTKDEAITTATEHATQRGYDCARYEASAEFSDGTWRVSFRGHELRPGDFFSVRVDNESGDATLFPGK